MNDKLQFDFAVDKANNTITIKRAFAAGRDLVWEAWTTPELLDQWYAPKPYRAETQTMDFREGGFWHYAMVSPQNEKRYSRYDYQKIEPQETIVELRGFCDENGVVSPELVRTVCTNVFTETDGQTLVTMTAKYGSPETLEMMLNFGFIDGMSACFGNLDALLAE